MKRWVCSPLRKIEEINDRLDAVEDLLGNSGVTGKVVDQL